MTEAEWQTSEHSWPMEKFIRERASERKHRLIGLACCGYPREFCDPRLTAFVDVLGRFADGMAAYDDVRVAREVAISEPYTSGAPTQYDREVLVLDKFSHRDAAHALERFLLGLASTLSAQDKGPWCQESLWCDWIRDIIGNPFRPVVVEPKWLTSDVVALARGIYDERAFDRLPILADALQDAGCENPDVLAHCRDPQLTHVRGCWVVDLVLGKS